MKKILLVDDSRAVRMVERKFVVPLGFQVFEAENGEVALQMVRQHPDLDVILLDWNMPIMDGLSFLKALRQERRARQPVVVMCTTENDLPRIVEATAAGANEFIMKPFTEEVVRDKLLEAGGL